MKIMSFKNIKHIKGAYYINSKTRMRHFFEIGEVKYYRNHYSEGV